MSKNIFFSSIKRQPLYSMVLFLLVCAAAFSFVMRATEFLVVRDGIHKAAGFYRSIGFLQIPGEAYGNVIAGAEIIGESRYIEFEDRRRGAEAILHDMQNINIGGRVGGGGSVLHGAEAAYIEVYERLHYAYFYAVIDRIIISDNHVTGNFVDLRVHIDDVLVGFPEHAIAGQQAQIHFHIDGGENLLEGMEVGERYFMRAALYWASTHGRGVRNNLPTRGQQMDFLYMRPLNNDGLLYIHVPYGDVDLTSPEMESIVADIERMHYNHSVVWLRTTSDMTAMPIMQEEFGQVHLRRGRFIEREDYEQANNVAVIHDGLAMMRGIDIGDTITVSVPSEQQIVDLHVVAFLGGRDVGGAVYRRENFIFTEGMMDFAILGNPHSEVLQEIELEVIGTFAKLPNTQTNYSISLFGNYIYIPDSVLTDSLLTVDNLHGYSDYVWSNWYSFTLADTRYERAFFHENSEKLTALGYNLVLIPSGAENFWTSAEPILQSISFNAIVFAIVLLMVIGLVVFLYLFRKRKEFAILRALGNPADKTVKQVCIPLIVLCLPAIILGGVLGRFFALREAADALYFIDDIEIAISVGWLFAQSGLVFVAMLAMVYPGAKQLAKLPVLELLQENTSKISWQTANDTPPPTILPINHTVMNHIIKTNHQSSNLNIITASMRFVFKMIIRTPLKTTLVLIVAAFLISTNGILHRTINGIENEIEHLYSSTIISGELVPASFMGSDEPVIFKHTAEIIMNSEIFINHYLEAVFNDAFIIPADEYGNFPEGVYNGFWIEFWREIREIYWGDASSRSNPLIAFSDFNAFLAEHGETPDDHTPGALDPGILDFGDLGVATGPLEIKFADGFSQEDFLYFVPSEPIPVILSDLTLIRRGLSLGDTAFIGHYFPNPWRASEVFDFPIKIIGVHNGSINRSMGRNAVLMPLTAMEAIRGDNLQYMALRFEADPAFNRDLHQISDEIYSQMRRHRQTGFFALNIHLNDDDLRIVAGMEQNLRLLQLLYPIAITVSLSIAAGLGILLLLQSAKVAAILRVLGFDKNLTRAIMCAEYVLVVLVGVLIGITFAAPLPSITVLYILAASIGALIGSIIITRYAPIDLLQVKG
ncbi:MAG: ABC transporter permease [Defluviitaleaceae bacterium]|nr:ABC transporter permease [Defluviitaleaceae bacterium]